MICVGRERDGKHVRNHRYHRDSGSLRRKDAHGLGPNGKKSAAIVKLCALLLQRLGMLQMLLERWQRFRGPCLQLRVIASARIGFEQLHSVLVGLNLHAGICGIELIGSELLKLVEFLLMLRIQTARQFRIDLADQRFQLISCFRMVCDHLLSESSDILVPFLRCELARLDFEHVADGDLGHEVLGRGLSESLDSEKSAD